mmetsp:Transcript_11436/g.27177  ORF Transcript_11436/g.27177 Transcript_11436/m.27177 type:complete len:219 (+) Transcript_11436:86-742(+)
MLAFMLATALAAPVGLRRLADVDAVDLGSAAKFAVLSKAGISTVPPSAITGDIGVSPISAAAITGFSLVKHSSDVYSTAWQVVNNGKVYAPEYASPTPSEMTTAISAMETAYTAVAGQPTSTETASASYVNVKTGLIGGTTFTRAACTRGTPTSCSPPTSPSRATPPTFSSSRPAAASKRAVARRSSSRAVPCPRTSCGRWPDSSRLALPRTSRASSS